MRKRWLALLMLGLGAWLVARVAGPALADRAREASDVLVSGALRATAQFGSESEPGENGHGS